jgi:DNA uptake protein ComE-like DNA-binding protein
MARKTEYKTVMKFIGPHFHLRKPQRNALLLLLVLVLCFPFLKDFVPLTPLAPLGEQSMRKHQKWIDSLSQINVSKPKIYPFNPNFLSDHRAYELGLEPQSIDRLLAYRKSGKWINSAEQFQSVSGVNDELMARLRPYFTFPKRKKTDPLIKKEFVKIGLNQCEALDLERIYGVGKKLSQRIVNYRKYLKGYSDVDQLYEVFGLDSIVVQRIQKRFEIKVLPQINKLLLDTLSYADLVALPYITVADARNIIQWRSSHGEIGFNDLQNIEGFDVLKIKRISLYLHTF